jgi:hypothetical protein
MTVLSFDGMDTTRTSMNVVLFLHYVCQYCSIRRNDRSCNVMKRGSVSSEDRMSKSISDVILPAESSADDSIPRTRNGRRSLGSDLEVMWLFVCNNTCTSFEDKRFPEFDGRLSPKLDRVWRTGESRNRREQMTRQRNATCISS